MTMMTRLPICQWFGLWQVRCRWSVGRRLRLSCRCRQVRPSPHMASPHMTRSNSWKTARAMAVSLVMTEPPRFTNNIQILRMALIRHTQGDRSACMAASPDKRRLLKEEIPFPGDKERRGTNRCVGLRRGIPPARAQDPIDQPRIHFESVSGFEVRLGALIQSASSDFLHQLIVSASQRLSVNIGVKYRRLRSGGKCRKYLRRYVPLIESTPRLSPQAGMSRLKHALASALLVTSFTGSLHHSVPTTLFQTVSPTPLHKVAQTWSVKDRLGSTSESSSARALVGRRLSLRCSGPT